MRKAKSFTGAPYDELELPLTLGRDFSGIIVSKGHGIGDRLRLGDQVWGVVPVEQQGCHANYVLVDSTMVNIISFTCHFSITFRKILFLLRLIYALKIYPT